MPAPDGIMVALTVDVEGFAESHAQSVGVPEEYLQVAGSDEEIRRNLDVTLAILARHACRGTFFFLGRIARTSPGLVRQVAESGHEIACHSLYHLRIQDQEPTEFGAGLAEAKARLEDAAGQRVLGFRAPEFSIGAGNLWALDKVAEAGFVYDSSLVPTGLHDVYGMRDAPEGIHRWPNGLIEFPLPVRRILGMRVPIGGGGYFRLYPMCWTCRFLSGRQKRGIPTAFYIHPYEVGGVCPRLPRLPAWRRFRHYVRMGKGRSRLEALLSGVRFTTMKDVLEQAGFLRAGAQL